MKYAVRAAAPLGKVHPIGRAGCERTGGEGARGVSVPAPRNRLRRPESTDPSPCRPWLPAGRGGSGERRRPARRPAGPAAARRGDAL